MGLLIVLITIGGPMRVPCVKEFSKEEFKKQLQFSNRDRVLYGVSGVPS